MRAHHLSPACTSSKTQLQTTGQMHEVKPRDFVLRMSGCYFSLQHNLFEAKGFPSTALKRPQHSLPPPLPCVHQNGRNMTSVSARL